MQPTHIMDSLSSTQCYQKNNMNIHDLTITDIKADLQDKKYSAVELTKEYLQQIKTLEPKLDAFVTVTEEKALEDAKRADDLLTNGQDLPLLGIPTSVKDNFSTKGITTTASANVLKNYKPPFNATVVEKLESAGMVMLGKTNMDAWAHGSSTETSDFGATKNPWNTDTLPGGSSGGAAASVAADECVVGIGSETAGSIRQPASWCGVVGLKPTYGRVSRYGVVAMGSSLDSPGPLTKTVEDAAIILQILAGQDVHDATTSPSAPKDYVTLMKDKRRMAIGISDDYFTGVDPQVIAKVQEALKVLEKQGHIVKTIKLFDPKYAIDVYTILQRSEVSSNLARYDGIRYGEPRTAFGEEALRRVMTGTYVLSAGYYDAFYKKAQKVRTLIIEDFAKAFESVDVIIGPTSPSVALPLGASKGHPMFGETADVLVEPSSIAGLCGINMPVGFNDEHLPVGMQIIGPQFAEDLVLNLAYQYEQDTNWRKEQPKL